MTWHYPNDCDKFFVRDSKLEDFGGQLWFYGVRRLDIIAKLGAE